MIPNEILVGSLLATAGLASVHLFSRVLRHLDGVPRARFLSVAGGISLSYAFLRLLPSVGAAQPTLEEAAEDIGPLRWMRYHAYVVTLLSVLVFYGLERLVKRTREEERARPPGEVPRPGVFWLQIGNFAVINLLIGALLVEYAFRGGLALVLFWLAMALKFIVNDHGLHEDHERYYDRVGRFVLVLAVTVGWVIGLFYFDVIPAAVIAMLQAAIAGSVLLNVLKEELPRDRKSRYWTFALGALAYGGLLLML